MVKRNYYLYQTVPSLTYLSFVFVCGTKLWMHQEQMNSTLGVHWASFSANYPTREEGPLRIGPWAAALMGFSISVVKWGGWGWRIRWIKGLHLGILNRMSSVYKTEFGIGVNSTFLGNKVIIQFSGKAASGLLSACMCRYPESKNWEGLLQ